MSTLFWITILIIAITVFVFVIVPWSQTPIITLAPMSKASASASAVSMIAPTEDHLAKFYKPTSDCIPEDHPRRAVESCPESKALSAALPIANVPLCVARQGDNLRLHATRQAPLAMSV